MPITRLDRSASAPPEPPELMAALVWTTGASVTPLPSETVRFSDQTMPCARAGCT
jgi:hypothetical protein